MVKASLGEDRPSRNSPQWRPSPIWLAEVQIAVLTEWGERDDGRADFNAVSHELRRSPSGCSTLRSTSWSSAAAIFDACRSANGGSFFMTFVNAASAPWLASVTSVPDGAALLARMRAARL